MEKVLAVGTFDQEELFLRIVEAEKDGQIKDVSGEYPDEFMVYGQSGLAYLEENGRRFRCSLWSLPGSGEASLRVESVRDH